MERLSAWASLTVDGGLSAITLDVHLQDRGVVDETIDCGKCHGVIWEDASPFTERLVGCDEHRAPLVARGDQFEQDACFIPVLGDIGDIVKNEQVVAVELGDIGF